MTKVIGHRGAPHQARENTAAAFRAAADAGADMVELDVRRTVDGVLAVHHDAVLEDGRLIVELARAELPDWIPDLDGAIDACEGMEINVEIKNSPRDLDFDPDDAVAAAVVALITRRALHERVIVSSFNLRTIDAIKKADHDIATGWLTLPSIDALSTVEIAHNGGHDALHPHDTTVTRELVDAAHSAGLALNTWTVDDPNRISELAEWGVDGIVTNVPDVAVALLRLD